MTICQTLRSLWPRRKKSYVLRYSPPFDEKSKAFDDSSSVSTIFNTKKKGLPYPPEEKPPLRVTVKRPLLTTDPVVTQRHYGISVRTSFDEKIHNEEDKSWNSLEERWDAVNQIKWLIGKSEYREIEAVTTCALYRTWDETGPAKMRIRVHAFEGKIPPTCLGSAGSMDAFEQGETILETVIDIGDRLDSPKLVPCTNSEGVKYDKFHHRAYMMLLEGGKVRIEFRHDGRVFFSADMDQ